MYWKIKFFANFRFYVFVIYYLFINWKISRRYVVELVFHFSMSALRTPYVNNWRRSRIFKPSKGFFFSWEFGKSNLDVFLPPHVSPLWLHISRFPRHVRTYIFTVYSWQNITYIYGKTGFLNCDGIYHEQKGRCKYKETGDNYYIKDASNSSIKENRKKAHVIWFT